MYISVGIEVPGLTRIFAQMLKEKLVRQACI